MPPIPDNFHVIGKVKVDDPCILPVLRYIELQGIVPEVLLLELVLLHRPCGGGETWAEARYDAVVAEGGVLYTDVTISHDNETIANIKVEEVN